MKKKIFSFLMTLLLLVGIGFTQNVYAASNWQQTSQGWRYYENGAVKGNGWVLSDGTWYYIDNSSFMQTGWLNENGTWYFLSDSGALDNSKTITVIPSELIIANNRIKQYVKENIHYSETISKDGKSIYRFYGEGLESPHEYYYTPGTDKVFQLNQGIITRLDTNEVVNSKYTYDQCKDIASAYFSNSHANGYKYTINSDEKPNSVGEYYFTIYSTATNQQVDAFHVSALTGKTS